MNVFNPALLARAFAFFAYTPAMSGEVAWYSTGKIHQLLGLEAHGSGEVIKSGATALEQLGSTGQMEWSAMDAFFGFIPGSVGETSTLAILIGAAILLFSGVASWRIMLSVFAGGLAFGYLFHALGMTAYDPYLHVLVGGFAFGAVFMATDPVTAAQTNSGKWIYGFMIGALAVLVRVINPAYPEGMMLAILFMNALAPLIDYFVVERNIARRKKLIKNVK
jgi:Na+-transporting NADH:ubiquinone oxidoreductase subunit B